MHQLRVSLPAARLDRYDAACYGTSVDGIEIYRWASSVALAAFDDLATLEVSMRSAMAQELARAYGLNWYDQTNLLDNGTLKLVKKAQDQGGLQSLAGSVAPQVLHGKLVASVTFGFWVKLLGRGGYQGYGASRTRRIYDTILWKPALRNAFPHVGDLERSKVETAARRVQALRNRIAHHEHIVWGVPIPGKRNSGGSPLRLSVSQAHQALLDLAGYLDSGLAGWLTGDTEVPSRLDECPIDRTKFLL